MSTEETAPEYVVRRTDRPVAISGQVAGTPWADAEVLSIGRFCWYQTGRKQDTRVRVLYDDRALYLQFHCRDMHIHSRCTQLNGPVSLDSCVELFAMPRPDEQDKYFNIEINCCCTLLVGFGAGRAGRVQIGRDLASRIRLAGALPGPTRDESPEDSAWWVAAEVPLDVLSELTGLAIRPAKGTVWRANFYRTGGKTDVQHSCWSPIDTDAFPSADFHRPEYFSKLTFE